MNHPQRELKSLFSCSSIVFVSFAVYIRQVSSAYNNSSELTASIFHIAEERHYDVWGREGIWIYDAKS